MPRTKVVELDGASFTIAPLTLKQVEEFLETQREALGMEKGAATFTIEQAAKANPRPEKLTNIWREFICIGLNNAIPPTMPASSSDKWTPERLVDEIDLVMFQRLRTEILEFSGLKSEVEEKKTERAAAAAS